MPMWVPVIAVPAVPLFLMGVLALSQAVEERVLSPRAMILSAARARRTRPDYAEAFVAMQFDRLLREAQAR